MKRDAVFNHIVEKRRHEKVQAVSFAMPGVTPGSIIEYRWRESNQDALANYVPVFAYREFPVEHLMMHIKPLQSPYFPDTMRYQPFHVNVPPFRARRTRLVHLQLDNLAAFEEEADAPPVSETCPWILISYSEDRKENPEHFWKTEGKHRWEIYRENIKVNGEVKSIAQEIAGSAASPEEKLKLLDLYCRKKIKNLASEETSDIDRQHFKPNKSSIDTLSRGIGNTMDIRFAFAALAEAAGFEARPAFLCDRETMLLDPAMMLPMLPKMDIAVSINGKWRLYDVTARFLEPGHLRWQEEGTRALIADSKEPGWVAVEMTPSSASKRRHQGQIKIDEQGTMEGDLHDTLTGHAAEEWREQYLRESQSGRQKRISESITGRLPGAEITELKFSDPANVL